jgi:hypothetical protein
MEAASPYKDVDKEALEFHWLFHPFVMK